MEVETSNFELFGLKQFSKMVETLFKYIWSISRDPQIEPSISEVRKDGFTTDGNTLNSLEGQENNIEVSSPRL